MRVTGTRWSAARRARRPLDLAVLAIALVVAGDAFLSAHANDPVRPKAAVAHDGFWAWTDQWRYLDAALAWSRGDLAPGHHWYLPGYPMLGALFVHVTPADPFLIPDLACLLATIVLCAFLADATMPHRPWSFPLAAVTVTAAIVAALPITSPMTGGATGPRQPLFLWLWSEPWSTTPTTPIALLCLLVALRFEAAPRAGLAFWAALLATGEALFRPTDAMILLAAVPPFMALALRRLSGRAVLPIVAAAVAGAAIPAALAAALHLLVHGLDRGSYFREAASTGFEWRLLPLRWVTIVISPRPLFPDGDGLAQIFPWIVPGLLCLLAGAAGALGGRRAAHRLVLAFVAVHGAVYLAYRDLHPQGMWRFHNDHYFRTTLVILAIYAPVLVVELLASRRRLAIAAIAAGSFVGLFAWRAEWRASPAGTPAPLRAADGRLVVPGAMRFPGDATLIPTDASFAAIYQSFFTTLAVGSRLYTMNADIKLVPVPGGMLLEPLRVLAPGPEILMLDPAIGPPLAGSIGTGRETVVFGVPCWFRAAAGCGVAATATRAPPARQGH